MQQVVLIELRLDLEHSGQLPIEIVHHVDPLQFRGARHLGNLMQPIRDGLPIAVKGFIIAAQTGKLGLTLATIAQDLSICAELNRVRQNAAHAADVIHVLIQGQLQSVGLLCESLDETPRVIEAFAGFHDSHRSA